jgi:hypothetical protein
MPSSRITRWECNSVSLPAGGTLSSVSLDTASL